MIGKNLFYYVLGGGVAAGGVYSIVYHFTGETPDWAPAPAGIPFFIVLGAILILGGVFFALRGQFEKTRELDKRDKPKGRGRHRMPPGM